MLRITPEQVGGVWLLRLEGRLMGAWVDELRNCWLSLADTAVRLELVDVAFVDAAGKALLAEMYRAGVHITARGVLATGICEEIVRRGCV
jgi:hypothetical protein